MEKKALKLVLRNFFHILKQIILGTNSEDLSDQDHQTDECYLFDFSLNLVLVQEI